MLNRSQLITLFGLSKRNENPSCRLSNDMRRLIVQIGSATFNQQSDIAKLLHHIAYGNLVAAKAMLEANPRLVLQAGKIETPYGLKVLHTTPLECALGAGDAEMAKMIAPYFDNFAGGNIIRDEQYARYHQRIKDMLNPEKNPPYDFTLLITTLIAAKQEDVAAALNCDMTHDSDLRDVLTQFRKDITPGSINVGMHFNYLHLLRALQVYEQHYDSLYMPGNNFYDKLRLYCRQVIGFIQRSLPAIDRMAFAQSSLYDVVENKAEIQRSLIITYYNTDTDFPVTDDRLSYHFGLGYDYFESGESTYASNEREWHLAKGLASRWKTYIEQKLQACRFMQPERNEKTSRCVIS